MKAMVYYESGHADVIRCVEVEKPAPASGQVLLRVSAAALNPVDAHLMKPVPAIVRMIFRLSPPTKEKPGVLGRDVAGVVVAVGEGVTDFEPGDEVFGSAAGSCAEFVCASESKLVPKPPNVTFEEASSVGVAAYTALQGLRDHGRMKRGDKVLINGASGGVGTFAIQIAKAHGCEVTAVTSEANADLVRSLGADSVIDYGREDFTKGDARYDIIYDLVGNHTLRSCSRVMTRNGTYLGAGILGGSLAAMFARTLTAPVRSKLTPQQFTIFIAKSCKEDLVVIGEMLAKGQVKPVIDHVYSLEEVPEAMRRLESKRARGKLVIAVHPLS